MVVFPPEKRPKYKLGEGAEGKIYRIGPNNAIKYIYPNPDYAELDPTREEFIAGHYVHMIAHLLFPDIFVDVTARSVKGMHFSQIMERIPFDEGSLHYYGHLDNACSRCSAHKRRCIEFMDGPEMRRVLNSGIRFEPKATNMGFTRNGNLKIFDLVANSNLPRSLNTDMLRRSMEEMHTPPDIRKRVETFLKRIRELVPQ
ncbi:MAG: hypothetical protein V1835_00255 [Candidatus Micrarchaeota archaeon]